VRGERGIERRGGERRRISRWGGGKHGGCRGNAEWGGEKERGTIA